MTASAGARAGRLAIWSSFLALSLRLLHGDAFGQLSIPLGSLDELAGWADHTSPAVMAVAVVRLVATAVAWYLLVATILAVVADVAGWRRLAAVVAALSPSVVRRLATRSAGVGLAAGALLAVTPMPPRIVAAPASATATAGVDPPPPGPTSPTGPTATMTRLPDSTEAPTPLDADPSTTTTTVPRAAAARPDRDPPQATMTRLPPTAPPPTTTTATTTSPLPTTPPPSTTTATTTSPLPAPPRPSTTSPTATTATMTRLPPTTPPTSTTAGTTANQPPTVPPTATTATMTRLPGSTPPGADGTAAPTQLPLPDAHVPRPADAANQPASRSGGPAEPWTVAAGDSFWSIAEEVLTDIAGHEPTDQAIRRYWLQLIETNRRRLADPANPDLLIPGQRLALPDPQ